MRSTNPGGADGAAARDEWPVLARRIRQLGVAVFTALLLMWPAAMNGQPFFFYDSVDYLHEANVGLAKLSAGRLADDWSEAQDVNRAMRSSAAGELLPHSPGATKRPPPAGRSIYYGVLADITAMVSGLWGIAALQSLAAGALLSLVYECFALRLGAQLAVSSAVAACTALALFCDFIMPDIWVGLALAALATQLAFPRKVSRGEAAFLGAFVCYGALAHASVILSLSIVLALTAGAMLRRRVIARANGASPAGANTCQAGLRRAFVVCAAALAVGMAGAAVFEQVTQRAIGNAPVMPPFLTARVIEDGAGARYLAEHCRPARFDACRYADRRFASAEDYLWGPRSPLASATAEQRRRLSAEDAAFAATVVSRYPLSQAGASARNALRQLLTIDISIVNYEPRELAWFAQAAPARVMAVLRSTPSAHGAWPTEALKLVEQAAILGVCVSMALVWGRLPVEHRRFFTAALAICVVNAIVCGATSGVWGRYEARVAWLVCVAGFCALAALCQRRRQAEP
ncbi:MAG TPA: hypothetical protein VG248_08890 [Caulobacteraceae bacterium]|nr:hypothetical protein [Caulobacteraceae bacterium]